MIDHHQLVVHFVAELLLDRLNAARRVTAPDREANRVFRRRLGDQDDVDLLRRERPEQPFRYPRHADHARTAQRQQREAVDGGDALGQRVGGLGGLVRDQRARRRRIERVLDQDRDMPGHGRRNRRRVDNLGAEIRQLHCLFVGHPRQHERALHELRIRAQHAVDVGPDLDDRRADGRADDGRAVVRPVSSDRRRLTVVGGADEARNDRDRGAALAEERNEAFSDRAVRHGEIHCRVRELVVRPHEITRIRQLGRVEAFQVGGQNQRGQSLAETGGHVERARRAVAKQVDALQRAFQLVEQRVHLLPHPGASARDERRDRRTMPAGDLVERAQVTRVAAFGETRAVEQLIRHATERRHHDEHRFVPARVENDRADSANGRRRSKRRPAELEHLHGKLCSVPCRGVGSSIAAGAGGVERAGHVVGASRGRSARARGTLRSARGRNRAACGCRRIRPATRRQARRRVAKRQPAGGPSFVSVRNAGLDSRKHRGPADALRAASRSGRLPRGSSFPAVIIG